MAVVYYHETVSIPVASYGDTPNKAENLAREAYTSYINKGFLAELDDEATEVRPGLFACNVYIKNRIAR